mgnify:CR=1 FL=1
MSAQHSKRFDLDRVLAAAVRSMIAGRHSPHCWHAWVQGKGYVNDGSPVFDRADYLQQLERAAKSEVENMGSAEKYAERGYTQPARCILFANWNVLPSAAGDLLEKLGYACEWSDEWTTCSDCQRALRTSPDGYDWRPYFEFFESDRNWSDPYHVSESGDLCLDCLQEWACSARENEREELSERASEESEAS